MTWLRIPDDALEDPRVVDLPDAAVVAYLRALGWSNRWARDGKIPARVAGDAAAAWTDAGLATVEADLSVRLVWLMEYQPSAEEITKRRELDAERQTRHRRHMAGDHSTCDPDRCRALLATRDKSRDTTREKRPSDPTRPDPTRKRGRGREAAAGVTSARALGRSPSEPSTPKVRTPDIDKKIERHLANAADATLPDAHRAMARGLAKDLEALYPAPSTERRADA